VLAEERDRLRETDSFTILEYIKTSIEILMNMKMEEHEEEMKKNKQIKGKGQGKAVNRSKAISEGGTKGLLEGRDDISESGSEFGKGDRGNEYE
jgi:hypothetical protein